MSRKQGPSDRQPVTGEGAERSIPDEVREAIAAAGQVAERLEAQGRRLHFALDAGSGGIVIEVQDLEGNVLGTIPPAKVMEIAAGAPLEL